MAFFEFKQNNSGGSFDYDAETGISRFVIIEADSPREAVDKAENIGLYFDGVYSGMDCECCGDRWFNIYWDEKGSDVPLVYGEPVDSFASAAKWMRGYEIFVHYKDGTKKGFCR